MRASPVSGGPLDGVVERTYGSLGIPIVFTGVAAMMFGGALLLFALNLHRWLPWTTLELVIEVLGVASIGLGIVHILNTPVRLHIRETQIGVTVLRGATQWFEKSQLSARIGRYGSTSRGVWVLRFDPKTGRRLVPLAFDPTMLMTDDGVTVEPSQLETVLGMPVKRSPWSP